LFSVFSLLVNVLHRAGDRTDRSWFCYERRIAGYYETTCRAAHYQERHKTSSTHCDRPLHSSLSTNSSLSDTGAAQWTLSL